jgi:YaiO family outer membrane protein
VYGGLRETRRFGLDDSEAYGGLYYPLGETWTGVVEGSVSPTYNVLAKYSIGGQLLKSLPGGWGLGGGFRHSQYELSAADVATLMGERYWGNYRVGYTFYSGHPEGSSSAPAHRFQFAYYYGDRDWVGISYTTGREVEYVGPPRGTITSDVRDWTLSGRHWLAPNWALSYDLLTHEQGVLYRRQGGRIGIRYLF